MFSAVSTHKPCAPAFSLRSTELASVLIHQAGAGAPSDEETPSEEAQEDLPRHPPWSRRERIGWIIGTTLTAVETLTAAEEDLTIDFLRSRGVCAAHFTEAGTKICDLKSRGATIDDLINFGYDLLDLLVLPDVAADMAASYGVDKCVERFCRSPSDAVGLAGSMAQRVFMLTSDMLLQRCSGCPLEAQSVLWQLYPTGLRGVSIHTLVDCRLTATWLLAAGYDLLSVSEGVLGSPLQLSRLGFTI